jgi:hypothetical protein
MRKKNTGEEEQEVNKSKEVKQSNKSVTGSQGNKGKAGGLGNRGKATSIGGSKRRAISLSDKLWRKLRIEAFKAEITVSEYVEKALSEKS